MDEEVQPSTFCPWQPKETPVIDAAFGALAYAGALIAEAHHHSGLEPAVPHRAGGCVVLHSHRRHES